MNLKTLLASSALFTLVSCAAADDKQDYNIYVYKHCEVIETIPMNTSQVEAYLALKQHEKKMAKSHLPMKEMEDELKVLREKLEKVEKKYPRQERESISQVKRAASEHRAIAAEMQNVVNSHRNDMGALKAAAREIEQAARTFEKAIKPSLTSYQGKNQYNIQISTQQPDWQCNT